MRSEARGAQRPRLPALLAWLGLIVALTPMAGQAQVIQTSTTNNTGGNSAKSPPLSLLIFGITGYEYNSNVFQVPNLAGYGASYGGGTINQLNDAVFAYGGGLSVREALSHQVFNVDLQAIQERYNQFQNLSHLDYRLSGGWRGQFADIVDAYLGASRTQTLAPFMLLYEPQLVVADDTQFNGGLGVTIASHWRLGETAAHDLSTWPLLNSSSPNGVDVLDLHDTRTETTFQYIGPNHFDAGILYSTDNGSFTGDIGSLIVHARPIAHGFDGFLPYRQTQIGLTASKDVSRLIVDEYPLSQFTGDIGWTRRTNDSSGAIAPVSEKGTLSAVTGDIVYRRKLSAKTVVEVKASRLFDSLVTNASTSMLSTALTLSAKWQATYRVLVKPTLMAEHGAFNFVANGYSGASGENNYSAGVVVEYTPRPWIALIPSATWMTRRSNYSPVDFTDVTYGINAEIKWQR